jgi:hypothetical protein
MSMRVAPAPAVILLPRYARQSRIGVGDTRAQPSYRMFIAWPLSRTSLDTYL